MYQQQPDENFNTILKKALGKKCKIYFIENVKFHFDTLPTLGNFIEVEAIDKDGSIGREKLQEQCDFYARLFKIDPADFVALSYSDLLLANTKNRMNNFFKNLF